MTQHSNGVIIYKMYKVYWTEDGITMGEEFEEMIDALNYCQCLRNEKARFVTMCSEISDMVGEFGVTEVSEGYNWKKRRI